jgi:AraC family transcriptional regulator
VAGSLSKSCSAPEIVLDRPNFDPDFDRLLFQSAHLAVGSFRAAPDHPRFVDSGPIAAHVFVFPRTSVTIQHAGGKPFAAGPPVVTFYNRNQIYRRSALSTDGDRCEWFALAPELLREAVAKSDPTVEERPEMPFLFSHGPSPARAYLRQRRLVTHCLGDEPPDALAAEETALELAHAVVAAAQTAWSARRKRPGAGDSGARCRDLVEHAKEILLRRFDEPFGLVELAREVGCTPFHLCRIFRRSTGWTLHEFRDQVRLRTALEAVPERRGDLTGLALDLGYSSHSHFTTTFKRAFGVTPSELARG